MTFLNSIPFEVSEAPCRSRINLCYQSGNAAAVSAISPEDAAAIPVISPEDAALVSAISPEILQLLP